MRWRHVSAYGVGSNEVLNVKRSVAAVSRHSNTFTDRSSPDMSGNDST
jgi:hypothetical protein